MARKKKLFGENISPCCQYCENGRTAPDNVMVLCRKFGPVSPHYHCKHYIYNSIKRKIPRLPNLPEFSDEDFKL